MTKEKIIKKIKESLNNLDDINISNTLKAEAIYTELETMFNEEIKNRGFDTIYLVNSEETNNVTH